MDASEYTLKEPDVSTELASSLMDDEADLHFKITQHECRETLKYLSTLRPKVKEIDGFWLFTFLHLNAIAEHITSKSDVHALSFLTDVELRQDPKDPRPFELIFHFKENPYFSNSTLSKKFSLREGVQPAPEDGSITQEMRDFDEGDLKTTAVKIDWKSSEKDLCALAPRVKAPAHEHGAECDHDDDDFEGDSGSFFWFFQDESDPFHIGDILVDELLPNVMRVFSGQMQDDDGEEDDEDELDEEDGDEEEDIDLEAEEEQPMRKKRKN
ncbi:hypothetical protein P7C73_g2036, partial [Tremellales sp. Uapishka_1]